MFANIFFEEANKYHVFVGLRFHKIKIGWMGCCGWVKKGGCCGWDLPVSQEFSQKIFRNPGTGKKNPGYRGFKSQYRKSYI